MREVPGAGHYTFAAPCGPALRRVVPEICVDAPGVSRVAVYHSLDAELVAFFVRTLHVER